MYFVPRAGAAFNSGVFELDADLASAQPAITDNSGAGLPDDWDRVYGETDHAVASAFKNDGAPNATIFTGGGSKDPIDINRWGWKDQSGGLPDKDNLLDAFAARYTITHNTANCASLTDDCQYLYFGADRFDNSGDAQIGFWFFRSAVSTNPDGSFNGTHTAGTVPHNANTPGDILILSDFTQGGSQPTIRVFEWVGSGGTDGTLNLIGGGPTDIRDCAVVSSDSFCASVNPSDGAESPWPFTNKSGQDSFGHGEFYEGGMNMNSLGLQNECFSSFVVETRSSQSVSATLKDFITDSFQNCTATMSTTPSATVSSPVTPGTAVHDTVTITGQGSASPPTPSGDVTFFLCGPIASGTCSTGGTNIGTGSLSGSGGVATADSPDVNTSAAKLDPGRYCFRSEWGGDTTYTPTPPATVFAEFGTGDSECFKVKDTSAITTAQKWLPQDTATVTTTGGTAVSGTVVFTLYDGADCVTGNEITTFTDTSAPFETNNTTYYTADQTVSWKAVFTPTDPNAVVGSTGTCENSSVTIAN